MKHAIRLSLLLLLLAPAARAQQGTITGVISDADDGLPLPGANVVIVGTTQGAAADLDGRYTISSVQPGTYTLLFSFTGYQNREVDVNLSAGETRTIDLALTAGVELDPIQVTAGRRQEKTLDAPASISVLTAREIEQTVGASSVEALRNTTGVDMAQTGIDRREVVLRGFNNAFSGASYVLTDYRHAAVPSLAVNIYSIMPNMSVDVDRVEVVRGPGSALYGAGVDAGVVHFFTKDPFTYPGITLSVSGGEQSLFGVQGRAAGVFNENLGAKVTFAYGQADDWTLDPSDAIDRGQLQQSRQCTRAADGTVLDFDSCRNYDFEKLNVNGSVEYRLGEQTTLIANAGLARLTATVLSGIGTLQADGFGYTYAQLRLQSGAFFAQAYVNKNEAGDSFVYAQDFNNDGRPDPVTDKGMLVSLQGQYDMSLADGREQLIMGVDVELTRPDTEGTILGRNEDDDAINEYGAYVQSTTNVSPQFDVTLALRGDYNDVNEIFRLSPRAALVYKPSNAHTLRATYNLAFSSPGTNSNFLDIIARAPDQTLPFAIRGRGAAQGYVWERNPAFLALGAPNDLVASSLVGCVGGNGLPLANPAQSCGAPIPVGMPHELAYAAIYSQIAATSIADITQQLQEAGLPVNEQVVEALVPLLNPQLTEVTGFSPGLMGLLNTTTGELTLGIDDLVDIKPLKQTITQTFELGYKGILNDKILLAVDGYVSQKKDFVGPLLMETPLVVVPTLSNELEGSLTQAITNNPQLAGALAQFGVPAQLVAEKIVELAGGALNGPLAIVQPLENNPGVGAVPELMLTYRNFGQITYYGVDASVQVLASEAVELFGNVSWVSDDFFDNEELDETNTSLSLALNAPTVKTRFGGSYTLPMGLSFNAAGRFNKGFPVRSGPYIGDVEDYFLLDVGAGYDFAEYVPGLRFDLGVSNVLDEQHREFIGAPQLGRMAIARLTYTVR